MDQELPYVQVVLRKGRGTRDQIANIGWIIEIAKEFQKNFYFIDYDKALNCVRHHKLCKIIQHIGTSDLLICLLRNLYEDQEAQLKLEMEKQTGVKSGKEFIKAVYCHSAYLTYIWSTS